MRNSFWGARMRTRIHDIGSLRSSAQWGAIVTVLAALSGCATTPSVPAVTAMAMPESPADSVIRVGDLVDVRFIYWPDYDVSQVIGADGTLELPVLGEVQAAGRTPDELRNELLTSYVGELRDPEIMVLVREEANRRVYVAGEVRSPGAVPIVGQLTVVEAVMTAGGLRNRSAKISNVLIIRRIGDRQYARTVNLREPFKMAEAEPFFVQANDVVFVPRTKIDYLNQWVDQYVNDAIPDVLEAYLLDEILDDSTGTVFAPGVTGGTDGGVSN